MYCIEPGYLGVVCLNNPFQEPVFEPTILKWFEGIGNLRKQLLKENIILYLRHSLDAEFWKDLSRMCALLNNSISQITNTNNTNIIKLSSQLWMNSANILPYFLL